jgi:hypothetical protein
MKQITINNEYIVFIDDEDYEDLVQYEWKILKGQNTDYAYRSILNRETRTQGTISMHRHILKLTKGDGKIVDHRDRNGLNNTKENLRIVSHQENIMNSYHIKKNSKSKYKGVQITESNRYKVKITINKQSYYIGIFKSEIKAARVYDSIVRYYYPDIAYTNFNSNHLDIISIEDAKLKYANEKSKEWDTKEAFLEQLKSFPMVKVKTG